MIGPSIFMVDYVKISFSTSGSFQHILDQDLLIPDSFKKPTSTNFVGHLRNRSTQETSQIDNISRDAMEDVQFSASAGDQMEPVVESTDQEFMPVEALESATVKDTSVVEEPEAVSEPTITKVDEVAMPEPVMEPEEPILPDHYYDDGNIPVFKPVRLSLISYLL